MSETALKIKRIRWSDPADRELASELRTTIFVKEQNVPAELELDAHDAEAKHVLIFDEGRAIGTGRMVIELPRGRIGRMAVRADQRGRGIGGVILNELIAWARELHLDDVYLHAQCHALAFYLKHGFVPHGPVFQEAGIDHQEMELKL